MHGLPKLVANVSSQFHHLVNTGLAIEFLVTWLPINIAHTCKLDTICGLLLADWNWLHLVVRHHDGWNHLGTKPSATNLLIGMGLLVASYDKESSGRFKNTYQSGTKSNLVAKIWPPTLVTICAWSPKLVANVSFHFDHLVNTGLTVGGLVKWLPIMVVHTCKLDTIWVVYISTIGNGSIWL